MTVARYTAAMEYADKLWKTARGLEKIAAELETDILHELGITYIDREPGFPCWGIVGLSGYFNTPLDALEAKDKLVGY